MKLRDLVILTGVVWIAPHTSALYALLVGCVCVVVGLALTFLGNNEP